jgi:hypothetical protein
MKDFLFDDNNKLRIENGDFVIGDSFEQECSIIARMSPGDLKSDPIIGPGLIQFQNSNAAPEDVRAAIRRSTDRDGKNWEDVKRVMQVILNKQ